MSIEDLAGQEQFLRQEEEWLQANGFYCDRLRATITTEQCAKNKRRALHPPPFEGELMAGPLYKCKTCEGGEVMSSTCNEPGCTKRAQHGKDGKCHGHWRKSTGIPRKPWGSNRKETTADQAGLALEIIESAGKRQVKESTGLNGLLAHADRVPGAGQTW